MKMRKNHRIMLLAAVIVAVCTFISISGWAGQHGEVSLGEVVRQLLELEERVAKVEQRLKALEQASTGKTLTPQQKKPMIEITSPRNGDKVIMDVIVEGIVRVDDLAGRYPTVGVHPMLTNTIWIQPLPVNVEKIQEGYRFRCRVYCGTPTQGIGEKFELYAFLPKKGLLNEGDQLDRLPKNVPVSPSVLVTRIQN